SSTALPPSHATSSCSHASAACRSPAHSSAWSWAAGSAWPSRGRSTRSPRRSSAAPFMLTAEPNPAPTIDLTVHFRTAMPRVADPDPNELCLARIRGGVIYEGFFEEDGVIWAADGTVLAQSRQLGLLLPQKTG